MIKINNQKYYNYEYKVSSENFIVGKFENGKHIESSGTAPHIKFCINDEILICIEMNYSFDMFKSLEFNKIVDITKNITDINFEDDNGWQTFIDEMTKCNVIRKNEKEFEFIIIVDDKVEEVRIEIDSIVII